MQIKNKINIIIYFFSFFLFSSNLAAEEFNITAKEIIIEKDNEILVGKGSVKAVDTEGKQVNADKITYEKSKEFCENMGGSLPIIKDRNEDKAMLKMLGGYVSIFTWLS